MSSSAAAMMPVFILAGLAALILFLLIVGAYCRVPGLRYRKRAVISSGNAPNWMIKLASLSRGTAPMVEGAEELKNRKVRELEPDRVSHDEHAAEDEDGDPDDGNPQP